MRHQQQHKNLISIKLHYTLLYYIYMYNDTIYTKIVTLKLLLCLLLFSYFFEFLSRNKHKSKITREKIKRSLTQEPCRYCLESYTEKEKNSSS